MAVQIRVSYKHESELKNILEKLGPEVVKCKIPKSQHGEYKKAYICLG